MIIVMKPEASEKNIFEVESLLKGLGLGVHTSKGEHVTIIGILGDKSVLRDTSLELMNGVDKCVPIMDTFKLANRKFMTSSSVVSVDGIEIGGDNIAVMAGPCAVESIDQLFESADAVKAAGANFLRGGAYKPRTSPYAFQGLEIEGLKYLKEAKERTGLRIVTEVISEEAVEAAEPYVDMYQIGARNMQNFYLLRKVGQSKKPVLLKRGLSATIDEWLNAAEYIMSEGNYNVVLCERGIRTFETATRNTLDLSAVAVLKSKTHLPVIVDPSHGTGKREYVLPMSLAAVAAGADGLMIEVHPNPLTALSDGPQSLNPEEFKALMKKVIKIFDFVKKG